METGRRGSSRGSAAGRFVDESSRCLPDEQLLLRKLRVQKHVVHTAKGHTCYGIAGIIPTGIPFESITLLTGKKSRV